jgi:hypothetical protein
MNEQGYNSMNAEPLPGPYVSPHLIYSYYVESTGIREIFETLFRSYLLSDEYLKLNYQTDAPLMTEIAAITNLLFPKPLSSITPDLTSLRHNAYWRLFGEKFLKYQPFRSRTEKWSCGSNTDFEKTLNDILYNIAQGILDKGITIEKIANPHALATLLNDLKQQLLNRTYNDIYAISNYWMCVFGRLRGLLGNTQLGNQLMGKLAISATDEKGRLIQLAEKLNLPIDLEKPDALKGPGSTESRMHVFKEHLSQSVAFFQLADRMTAFLIQVENTNWDSTNAAGLYNDPQSEIRFKEIMSALESLPSEKDYPRRKPYLEALASRKRV